MPRIQPLKVDEATGKSKELLESVQAKFGMVPNVLGGMANGPALLQGYLGLGAALDEGSLSLQLREKIALAVSQVNECNYCVAGHSMIGAMVGLTPDEIVESRKGTSSDEKTEAAVQLARALAEKRGRVSDEDVQKVRGAGYSDGEIAEILASVLQTLFTNYFNHIAETDLDFPEAPPL